jgi:hypothetical protein
MNSNITTTTTPSMFSAANQQVINLNNSAHTVTVESIQQVIDLCQRADNTFWLEMLIDFRSAVLAGRFLSEKQVACINKAAVQSHQKMATAEARTQACTERLNAGRYRVEATVLSTKWQDSDFGSTLKMLVVTAGGFKLWGSVPAALQEVDSLIGRKVSFVATVSPKPDDAFGFFSRPAAPALA